MPRLAVLVLLAVALLGTTGARAVERSDGPGTFADADAAAYRAVGRLELGRGAFCTATLIAPQIVLTAGHCLLDPETGAPLDMGAVAFRAGLRDGSPAAHRAARRLVVHPLYRWGETELAALAFDLALVELDAPIPPDLVAAIPLGRGPAQGARVGIVSYRIDRAERAGLQGDCRVLALRAGAIVTDCGVEFGASGAPILAFDTAGAPRLVSVVSAKASARAQDVSIGTALRDPLDALLAELGEGATPSATSAAHDHLTARFIRP